MNFPRVSETGFQVWFWCLNYFFVVLFLFQSISYLLVSSFMLQLVVLASCILAFFLNYRIFFKTTINSSLTQTMCENLKDLHVCCVSRVGIVFSTTQENFVDFPVKDAISWNISDLPSPMLCVHNNVQSISSSSLSKARGIRDMWNVDIVRQYSPSLSICKDLFHTCLLLESMWQHQSYISRQ